MMGRGVRLMRALAKRPCASGRHGELRQARPPSMIDPGPESQVPGMGGLRSGIGRQSTRPVSTALPAHDSNHLLAAVHRDHDCQVRACAEGAAP